MARRKRKKIEFTEESVNELLQEIYNDTHNIRAKITRLFTKWEAKVKENGEVQAVGDQIVKLIAAEAKNQDQKLMLLKYLKEIVLDNKTGAGNTTNTSSSSTDDDGKFDAERRNALMDMVNKGIKENK